MDIKELKKCLDNCRNRIEYKETKTYRDKYGYELYSMDCMECPYREYEECINKLLFDTVSVLFNIKDKE